MVLSLIAAVICLALYIATAAPGLTWAHDGADGGDLIAACETGGVPHPGGYPTYCLLARTFARLPLGNLARRYTLFSALAAALSVGIACDLFYRMVLRGGLRERPAAVLALLSSLIWGLGPALWSQAVITEVYALHALLAALLIWRAFILDDSSPARAWMVLGLAAGLGLGNHLTLVLILPGLLVWLWPFYTPRRALATAGGLMLGLCVYLYVPLAARGNPPVAWGDPRDWRGFWWLVSGQLYRGYVFATPWRQVLARTPALAALITAQYTLPGLALALLGLETGGGPLSRRMLWGSVLVALLPAVYALGYNTTDSTVYLLPVWLMGTFWLVLGAQAGWHALETQRKFRAPVAVGLVLVAVWLGIRGYDAQNLRGDRSAEDWLAAVVAQAPEGALLISGEDGHTFALDYMQWAMEKRTDLLAVDGELWAYPWYRRQLQSRHPGVALPAEATLEDLIAARLPQGTVYLTSPRPALNALYEVKALAAAPAGVLWQVQPRAQ
jgi:hypothetical protein